MKTMSVYLFIVLLAVVSGYQGLFAEEPATPFEGKTEQELIVYLGSHRIPTPCYPSGPAPDAPPYVAEVKEALKLFKAGSGRLRLAIAKSLVWAIGSGMEFWNACSVDDYEARHFLVGIALSDAKLYEKDAIIKWLLHDSHPSLAGAMLRGLTDQALYEGFNPNELDRMIEPLRQWYRQPGKVVCFPQLSDNPVERDYTIWEKVVDLLPRTAKGSDLLQEWISADGKKVDEETLGAMWDRLERMKYKDKEFWVTHADRLDIVEPFLLSPKHPCHDLFGFMEKSAWKQVYNPDDRVRRAAMRFAIVWFRDAGEQCVAFIRPLPASHMMRQKALADAKAVYEQIIEVRPGQYRPIAADAARREDFFRKLMAAIEGKEP